jgi:hypothetical protein
MTKSLRPAALAGFALPVLALAFAACAPAQPVAVTGGSGSDAGGVPAAQQTDTEADLSGAQRVYYHEPSDDSNVSYFDRRSPEVVVTRVICRERDGRTYYVERQGGADRHFYFDDAAARAYRPRRDADDSFSGITLKFVLEASQPERVHYRESRDVTNVYYYDQRRPEVVVTSRVYRERDGRTFYVDRDGGKDRRFYFDDKAAHARHHDRDDRRGDGDENRDKNHR